MGAKVHVLKAVSYTHLDVYKRQEQQPFLYGMINNTFTMKSLILAQDER